MNEIKDVNCAGNHLNHTQTDPQWSFYEVMNVTPFFQDYNEKIGMMPSLADWVDY
jgi:hypothetical protein